MNKNFKRALSFGLSVAMTAGLATFSVSAEEQQKTSRFTDIDPNASYAAAVEALAEKGIMGGIGDDQFAPGMEVNRAQAITVLGRLAGITPVETDDFSDVIPGEFYAGYVGWAVQNGIVNGVGDGKFDPAGTLASSHLNLMISRYAKTIDKEVELYDTGATTVTRADLAQRLYTLVESIEGKNDPQPTPTPEVIYKTEYVYETEYVDKIVDEAKTDSEVVMPVRVEVSSTGRAGCSPNETDADHDAHSSHGWIMGYNDRGVYTFKGIQYGTAKRFENPKPANVYGRNNTVTNLYSTDKDEPTLAMVRGAASPQAKTNTVYSDYFGFAYFMTPAGEDMYGKEEECLNLNVWTSSMESSAKKPVLVFMHGGGTDSDAATGLEVYEGRDFAEHNDIVFVTVNARLGSLGYSRDFTEIGGGNNLAVRDMLLSLEWVKENIASFGGDPENITIAGQSGGGSKVSYLVDSKYAEENDLFQKVVAISASLGSNVQGEAAKQESRNTVTRNWVNTIKNEGRGNLNTYSNDSDVLVYLQSVRTDEVSTALRGYSGGQTIDNYIFDDKSACWSSDTISERAARYTYLIGNTWSEMVGADSIEVIQNNQYTRAKGYMTEEQKTELMEQFRLSGEDHMVGTLEELKTAFHKVFPDHDFYDLRTLVDYGQGGFTRDNYYNSSMRVGNSGATVYEYLMAYEFPYFGGTAMYHTGDLAFWFYSLGNVRYQIAGDEETAYEVADFCANALANFCKTGDPSANGITWLPHEDGNAHCMIIDEETRLVDGDYGDELGALMEMVPKYLADTELTADENGKYQINDISSTFIRTARMGWYGYTYSYTAVTEAQVTNGVFNGSLNNNQNLVIRNLNPEW